MQTHPSAMANWRRSRTELLRTVLSPPPKLTVCEWADRYRMLSREASSEPGKYRSSRAPYQRGIMDAISDPLIERVVCMLASQTGKTEVVNNVVGFHVDQDPAPILVVQPTLDMAEAWSKDRLAPMVRDTPRLRGKIKDPRARDSGNTITHKNFPGGHLTIVGANSAAGLAARPIRIVLCDEIDRFPASAGSEGDPVSLAMRRTSTFWNRKIVLISTPTLKGFSRVEKAFHETDQRHYHVPCPDCAHLQKLVWSHLKWDNADPSTAHYVCEGCGVCIEESQKHRMLEQGVWVAENPGSRFAGFHLNALYSPWSRWEDLVREWLESKGDMERLKQFVNTVLAETWEEEGEQVSADSLRARANETYPAEVPKGVGLLTAAVDVQGDRLELKVKGWGAGQESWRILYEQIWGDPGREDVWVKLAEFIDRGYQHEGGPILHIASCAIDTGGHHADMVYRFSASRQPRVWAVKGSSSPGRPVWGRPSKVNKHGARSVPIGTDTAKDIIFTRLKIKEAGPGYMHLPQICDDEYLAQLTSEKVVTRYVKGRPVRAYEKTRPRNEALDLEVYNLAALHSLGPLTVNSLGLLADQLNSEPEVEEGPPQEPPARPSSWATSWR